MCKLLPVQAFNFHLLSQLVIHIYSHVIQMSANQIVNQTTQELMALAAAARLSGDRMSHLQLDRLKLEFEKSLQRYSTLQKVAHFNCIAVCF